MPLCPLQTGSPIACCEHLSHIEPPWPNGLLGLPEAAQNCVLIPYCLAQLCPDLNPIEHVWDNLDHRVRHGPIPLSKVDQLTQALISEWNNIPQAEINTLICSMRQRGQAVLHAEGGQTRY